MFMIKFLYSIILVLYCFSAQGQSKKETISYFDLIKSIVNSEKLDTNLIHKLDKLKSKFISSRSYLEDYFNRDIGFGFKHRRITLSLNFVGYRVDLLCRNDTIFLSCITSSNYKGINYDNLNEGVISQFLKNRNKFYNSNKSSQQLIKEISLLEEYAFYCGDGMPKTQKGKYVEQLVNNENTEKLIDMIKSFNCETQAYGVAGLVMLEKSEYKIPCDIQKIIDHIKKRNSDLIVCSGCFSGLINKIYSKK